MSARDGWSRLKRPHDDDLLADHGAEARATRLRAGSLRVFMGGLLAREAPQQRQWCRKVMNEDIAGFIDTLDREGSWAVEISGTLHNDPGWRFYESLSFPEFDLCTSSPDRNFDVVICEQVLEHVADPWRATETLHELCRPGGHLIVSTPFLVKLHKEPEDYWRFTPDGMRLLLERAGFEVLKVRSWGNESCVQRNFAHWAPYQRWRSLRNDEDLPIVVWAFARRRP